MPHSPKPSRQPEREASGATPPNADLESFAVQLRRINAEVTRFTQEFAHAHGLHHTDVQALAALLDGRATTPGTLQAELNVTSGAVSACLNRLERAGHVARTRDEHDARVVRVHYTAAGRTLARNHFLPLARTTEAARAQFGEGDLDLVLRFLTLLGDGLSRGDPTGPG